MRKNVSVHYFADRVLDILVSQTVDQGIQHGDHHCVKHRGHFDSVPGVLGVGHTVEEEDGAVEDGDGGQVGGTGGEGSAATCSRGHLEDGDNDKDVRKENNEECADLIKGGKDEKQQLVERGVRASEGEQSGEFTEEVIDCVETTEG